MSDLKSIVVDRPEVVIDRGPNTPVVQVTASAGGKRVFSLLIECETPAFGTGPMADRAELAKVLLIAVDDIEKLRLKTNGTLTLRDRDGLTVGFATMQGE